MNCENKRKEIVITKEQKEAIEAELSKENNVELMNTPKGVVIKRIMRETIKLNN